MAGFAGNRYYNDPALGAAFANLAQAFAPPSAQDMAAYSSAGLNRQKYDQLAQLFAAGGSPSEQAALIGAQTYGATPQGFTYKVEQDNATQRYGYDTQAATSTANNAADNARAMDEARLRDATQRYGYDSEMEGKKYSADQSRVAAMFGTAYGALDPGQVRPAIPQAEASMFGLPGGLAPAQGAPKPLGMDEVKAADYLRLPQPQRDAIVFGSTPIEQVLDPTTGAPVNVTAPEALGRAPAPEVPTSVQEFEYWLKNAAFGDWKERNARAGATSIDMGGGTDKQVFDAMKDAHASAQAAKVGLAAIGEARKAVEDGVITGAFADARLAAAKAAQLMGLGDPETIINTETFRAAIAPQVAAMMKATVGSTQVSNADREFAAQAAAGSITLDSRSIARLLGIMERAQGAIVDRYQAQLDAVYPSQDPRFARERALFGLTAPGVAPAGTQPPAIPAAPQGPVRVNTPEEAMQLPPGTKIILPDGTEGVVPNG